MNIPQCIILENIPRHTPSMVAYMILTEYFLKNSVKNCIVGMLLTCPITGLLKRDGIDTTQSKEYGFS